MKKLILFYCLLILLNWSCKQETSPMDQVVPNPAGKYLAEVKSNLIPLNEADTTKIITFEYNSKRFLTKVSFWDIDNDKPIRYSEFVYNSDGLLNHINTHFTGNNNLIVEKFRYENKKLVLVEGYQTEYGKTTLIGKTTYKVDSENNVVEFHPYDLIEAQLIEREAYQKYYFNSKGDLTKYHYNIGQGGFFETMEDFEYDNMISPFANFNFQYYNILGAYFYPGECLSTNNVIRHKDYNYENGTSYNKSVYDTIIYKYEQKFPIEASQYRCSPNSPMELASQYFFKYVDLK